MKSLRTVVFTVTITIGMAVLSACAGLMDDTKGTMTEKGDAMGKGDSMMEPEKSMMKKPSGSMTEKAEPGDNRTAKLTGATSHHASELVAITTDPNGQVILTLEEIDVDRVPDGRVYLAKNGDYRRGVELGKLAQFSGTIGFRIPRTMTVWSSGAKSLVLRSVMPSSKRE